MAVADQARLEAIGTAMAKVVPDGWARAVLKVSAVAATMETQLAVEMLDGSIDAGLSVDVEAQIACDDLRDAMYEEGKGTWYNAEFVPRQDRASKRDSPTRLRPSMGAGRRTCSMMISERIHATPLTCRLGIRRLTGPSRIDHLTGGGLLARSV
ncbi:MULTISPECIES: hypothetical protein [unclassified Kribbella]|uniref:hypothetical protein n=1 Tax=unclassified Kribbella TaxID=2644121 RepID=UPI003018C8D8